MAELIIIGAGIAGVSAAVYAKRSGLDFLIFEAKVVGGQLLFMENIDNYVGLGLGVKGREMALKLSQTLEGLGINISGEEIVKAEIKEKKVSLHTESGVYSAKGLIIATGAAFKRLGIEGEAEFSGKGVSYCAVCDGFFFKGKDVVVVGGGNTAAEEALYLSEIARKVTLIHRRSELRALDYLKKRIFEKTNIQVLFNTVVKEIKGENFVSEVVLEEVETGQTRYLPAQGLFAAIGTAPGTEAFKDAVSMDNEGFIFTDEQMKTSSDFIWAAGDCRRRPLKQLITAASEGAIAAISAYKYLKGHYISS